MTPEQQQAFDAWLKKRAPKLTKCPVCESGPLAYRFIIGPGELQPPGSAGAITGGGPRTALVELMCNHCGYVLHFDAQKTGIPLPK